MPQWFSVLGQLSPVVAIALLFGWSKHNDNKSRVNEEKARIELIKVLASEWVQPIAEGLDANTEAVKEAVKHNERIIDNHISHTDAVFKSVVTAIEQSNNRRRATD